MRRIPGQKLYHFAAKIAENGDVSALCFATPRAIDIQVASWTIRPAAVTCPRCRRILAAAPEKAGKYGASP